MAKKEIKQELIELFGTKIKFNKNFQELANQLKQGMQEDLINWCIECEEGIALGSVPPKKQYKNLFVFFKKIGNQIRAILIKEQNKNFIEINLTNHNYYDKKRQELGYKKSSYYKS